MIYKEELEAKWLKNIKDTEIARNEHDDEKHKAQLTGMIHAYENAIHDLKEMPLPDYERGVLEEMKQLLIDCRVPINFLHNNNHKESILLDRISNAIAELERRDKIWK